MNSILIDIANVFLIKLSNDQITDIKHAFGIIGMVIQILIGIAIMICVFIQGGKTQGLGGVLTGSIGSNLFQKIKEYGFDKFMTKLTLTLGIAFILFAFLLWILNSYDLIII